MKFIVIGQPISLLLGVVVFLSLSRVLGDTGFSLWAIFSSATVFTVHMQSSIQNVWLRLPHSDYGEDDARDKRRQLQVSYIRLGGFCVTVFAALIAAYLSLTGFAYGLPYWAAYIAMFAAIYFVADRYVMLLLGGRLREFYIITLSTRALFAALTIALLAAGFGLWAPVLAIGLSNAASAIAVLLSLRETIGSIAEMPWRRSLTGSVTFNPLFFVLPASQLTIAVFFLGTISTFDDAANQAEFALANAISAVAMTLALAPSLYLIQAQRNLLGWGARRSVAIWTAASVMSFGAAVFVGISLTQTYPSAFGRPAASSVYAILLLAIIALEIANQIAGNFLQIRRITSFAKPVLTTYGVGIAAFALLVVAQLYAAGVVALITAQLAVLSILVYRTAGDTR